MYRGDPMEQPVNFPLLSLTLKVKCQLGYDVNQHHQLFFNEEAVELWLFFALQMQYYLCLSWPCVQCLWSW